MTISRRILLAVDDSALRQILSEHLENGGHVVVEQGPHDLTIADEVCGEDRVRALTAQGPVILLGGAGTWGAEKVLAKPVRLAAVLAAIEETCRPKHGKVTVGPWSFDGTTGILRSRNGDIRRLTGKEAAILSYLAQDGGTVPRDRLLAEIWGYSAAVTTHTLETHIYRLRQKLERGQEQGALLVTENGGYRLQS